MVNDFCPLNHYLKFFSLPKQDKHIKANQLLKVKICKQDLLTYSFKN